jgi:hypothetical protein
MTAEQRGEEFDPAMRPHVGVEAIRDRLTAQLVASCAKARAAERDKMEQELAAALGITGPEAAEHGFDSLVGMVLGVRAIADIVIGTALPEVDAGRRQELLVAFGVAEYWSRVKLAAEMNADGFRAALGLGDDGRPVPPG